MKLIIKIPDELYKKLKTPKTVGLSEAFDQRAILVRAIQNGTVLPKGHGRLIEANHFNTECGIRAVDCLGKCEKCSDCVVKYEDICNAKTIIEAE